MSASINSQDVPSAVDLLAAVEEFLRGSVLPAVDDELRFYVRVSANVLAIVQRELVQGGQLAIEHERALTSIGATDEADLASKLRSGVLDYRDPAIVSMIRQTVRAKLAIARPGFGQAD